MDINRVRYFSVIAEMKHVRKAAEILGINPASLSKAIKLLESEVGFKLLTPAGRGIEITDRGLIFYRRSRALLHEHARLKESLIEQGNDQVVPVRLGSMEVFTTYFLTRFLEQEKTRYRLQTRYLTPGRIEDALKSREIDVGVTYLRLPVEELNYLKVGEFQMRIFGAPSMVGKKFKDLQFVVPIDGVYAPGVSLRSLDGWPDDRFPRRIQYEFELLETALQISRIGQAVVYCPDFVVKLHNTQVHPSLKLVEISPPTGFKDKRLPIYLVMHRNEAESAFVRNLAKVARSL